jgi:hypothetical protein
MTWRVASSLVLYDSLKQAYDLSSVEKLETPYIKNLLSYFYEYPSNTAHRSDMISLFEWNKVVGDLGDGITYNKEGALATGYCNGVRVFEKILGLQLGIPQGIGLEEWVERSFEKIFKTLNPIKVYKVDFRGFNKSLEEECYGQIKVNVTDQYKSEILFYINQSPQHSYVGSIIEPTKTQEIKYDIFSKIKVKSNIEESLNFSKNLSLLLNPFYHIFSKKLDNNDDYNDFLRRLYILPNMIKKNNENHLFIKKHSTILQNILSRVLEKIEWNDRDSERNDTILSLISSRIERIINNIELYNFYNIIYLNTKGLYVKKLDWNFLKNFHNLETVILTSTFNFDIINNKLKNLKNLTIKNLDTNNEIKFDKNSEKLERLTLEDVSISHIGDLDQLQNLRNIFIKKALKLKALKVNENLDTLNIENSSIEEIVGLEGHLKIRHIRLKKVPNFTKLTFSEKNEEIQNIELDNTSIRQIKDLHLLSKLETIYMLGENYTLLKFSAENKSLQSIRIFQSKIEELEVDVLPQKGKLTLELMEGGEYVKKLRLKRGINVRGIEETDERITWLD